MVDQSSTSTMTTMMSSKLTRSGVLNFVLGCLFGFFVASSLSLYATFQLLSMKEGIDNAQLKIAHNALRALQSVRYFPESNGWSLIHVFDGENSDNHNHKNNQQNHHHSHILQASSINKEYFYSNPKWFSQSQQDHLVSHLLKNKTNGYFLDISANDPIKISNTYALETYYNWTGICVEPNPKYWEGLSYRKCDVVAAVLGQSRDKEVTFKFPNRAAPQGGIIGTQFDNKNPSKFTNEDKLRYTVTLEEVLHRFGSPKVIDYLSLDVEGSEEYILAKFPFDKYQFHLITIERPSDHLRQVLRDNDYLELTEIKHALGEFLWVHKSMLKFLDMTALDIDTEHYKYRERTSTSDGDNNKEK